jgi:hypothetical protein
LAQKLTLFRTTSTNSSLVSGAIRAFIKAAKLLPISKLSTLLCFRAEMLALVHRCCNEEVRKSFTDKDIMFVSSKKDSKAEGYVKQHILKSIGDSPAGTRIFGAA